LGCDYLRIKGSRLDELVNAVATRTEFFWRKLVSFWMLDVVSTDPLVTVKAKRDSVVSVVGATHSLVDDMSSFDVDIALLEAQTAQATTTNEHFDLCLGAKRHYSLLTCDERIEQEVINFGAERYVARQDYLC